MVVSAKARTRLWLWIWIFLSWSHVGSATLHPMMPTPAPIPQFTSHSGQVCSTWGNYHFKTFNGDMFYFPGTCNYLFASHCESNNEDFNIQIRRSVEDGMPVIRQITALLDGVEVEIRNKSITLDGVLVTEIPAEKSRVHIDKLGSNIKITASTDISLIWNGEDSLLLKLNRNKYANKTCGICGDFSGVPGFNLEGKQLTAVQYGNLQKRNGPTEECLDVPPSPPSDCKDVDEICKSILTSAAFSNCNNILEPMNYIDACVQDLCHCNTEQNMHCKCSMFAEYSRQCTHSGGVPGNWRTTQMCSQSCPFNMVYQECGSPCPNTCSNTERTRLCEDHCIDGCFCPPGTVLDDIKNTGCIPQEECSCVYNSETYNPGSSFNTPCRECTCSRGKWKCKEFPCTGTCSVEGGSHITSFDGSRYSIDGDCSYVLAKHNTANDFSVLVEMRRCGITNKKSCLKSIVLGFNKGETVLVIKDNAVLFLNWIPIQLPISVGNMTIFWSTSFYMNIHTPFDLVMQVQFIPVMQVYVILGPSYHDQTCGLCGNFNNIQSDDFKAISGVSEGTAASFANTWKSNSNCPNIKNSFDDPCSLNLEKEKYAQHWCGLLISPNGTFTPCHKIENPLLYHTNCLSDTCSCKDSEECMCAALASYAYACAKKGVTLLGWRDNVCEKYTQTCKDSQVYQYNVTRCQPTCRSRSNDDTTFDFQFPPVDGCVCKEGTYLNDNGDCVTSSSCPCYYQGNVMESGELVEENGITCTCERGQLTCMGAVIKAPVCSHPLVYLNCSSAPKGTKGVECQKSCHTLDMDCFSSQCMSGCVCPPGLVSDGKGGCLSEQQCPCIHNEATYRPGDSISVGCNTCICKNRRWQCTHKPCLGTCSVYGDGHYITFDNKQFTFSGSCEYILAQDNCGENGGQGSFSIITENVPCGTTGTTCSKNIKFFLGGKELRLDNEKIEVVKRKDENNIPYSVMRRGMYFILKSDNGVILMWDKKTTIHVKLASHLKGKVCGICGNYDDKESNDFTTRSQSVVENLIEFGNSWKTDPSCPDVQVIKDPCSMNPYRKAWALRQCAIITSEVFQRCHAQVDPKKYYESCISDSCACDTGGDCECFCTTVALYAQACSESGICINWRTPTICPMFCDYYNDVGECEWHYKPCGDKCIKTCRNPKGECLHEVSGCEGCYPKCPPSRPFFNEDTMKCVAHCGCIDESGNYYNHGDKVKRFCYSCVCSMEDGINCQYDDNACVCEHEGKQYKINATIPNGNETCTEKKCDEDGQIVTIRNICTTKPPTEAIKEPTAQTTKVTESSTTSISTTTTGIPTSIRITTSTMHTTTKHTTSLVTSSKSQSTSNPPSTIHATTGTTHISVTTSKHPTLSLTSSVTTSTSSSTTPCHKCHWSDWIDKNHPTSDIDGGDEENFEAAEADGIKVCSYKKFISDIQCSATSYPGISIEELSQTVTCNIETGLLCRNRDNQGEFNLCYNYKVRFYCCEEYNCPSTTLSTTPFLPGTSTTVTPLRTTTKFTSGNPSTTTNFIPPFPETTSAYPIFTTSISNSPSESTKTKTLSPLSTSTSPIITKTATSLETTLKSQSTSNPLPKPSTEATTGTTTHFPVTTSKHPTSSLTSSVTTSTSSSTTPCHKCHWSDWIDKNHPTSDIDGGDEENFEAAEADGIKVCSYKKFISDIQCSATSYPGISIEELSQTVTCNIETGLLCRNRDNQGKFNLCYNYKVRFYCCEEYNCPSTTLSTTPFLPGTSTTVTPLRTTTKFTSGNPSTTTNFIPPFPETTSAYPIFTTSISNSPSESTKTKTLSPLSTSTSPIITKTATSLETTLKSQSTSNPLPKPSTEATTGTTTHFPVTTSKHPTSSLTSSVTTSTSSSTTPCHKCHWSDWIDKNHPTSDIDGGDEENFEAAEADGIKVCSYKKFISDIQCSATSYPGISIEELSQTVTCNIETGLLCRNRDNQGEFNLCYNYKVRFYCCEEYNCPSTTLSTTPFLPGTSTTVTPLRTTTKFTSGNPSTTTNFIPPFPETTSAYPIFTTSISNSPSESTKTKTLSPLSTSTSPIITKTATSLETTLKSQSTSNPLPKPSTEATTGTTTHFPVTTSKHPTSSLTSSVTTSTSSSTTPCHKCHWSDWIDKNHPTSDIDGGDEENFEAAEADGIKVCSYKKFISDIQCSATSYPGISIEELSQTVTCNIETGLLCRNRDNQGEFNLCYNYKVRFYCCEEYNCPSTTLSTTPFLPGTSTTVTPLRTTTKFTSGNPSTTTNFIPPFPETTSAYPIFTTSISNSPSESTKTKTLSPLSTSTSPIITKTATSLETTLKSQSTSNPLPKPSTEATTGTTTHFPVTTSKHPTSSLTSSVTTSTSSSTTPCHKCHWSDWIDKNHPTSDIDGGDEENFEAAEADGIKVCSYKKFISDIQCSATSYPGISIEELSQTVTCNIETGLLCRNRDNQGKFNLCYNYKVRFYCCEEYNCPSTTLSTTPFLPGTSTTVTPLRTTTKFTSGNPSTTTNFIPPFPETTSAYPIFTTSISNSPSESTKTKTLSPLSTSTSPIITKTATSLETTLKSQSTSNPLPKPSTEATTGTTTHFPVTTSKHPTSSLTSSVTTSTSSSTTPCHKCHWSDWIDKNHPTSDIDGGDEENFEAAEADGIKVCSYKKFISDIQCSATSYPGISIEELSQTVTCNIETGLLCRNRDNQGKFNLCYNYKVRFYCCEEYNCPSTTLSTTPFLPGTSTTVTPLRTTTKFTSGNPSTTTNFIPPFPETTSAYPIFTTSISNSPSESTKTKTLSPLSTSTSPIITKTATSLETTLKSQSTSNPLPKPSTEATTGTTTHFPVTTSEHPTSSLTSSITTSTLLTTSPCHKCHWSDWIDKNYPTSDIEGGDEENFETAEADRIKVCSYKKFIRDIQCSATSYPGIPIEELSQTVICNIETGLLCRNRDNQGEFNMCYNYKVRFYCCEEYNCPSATLSTASFLPGTSTTVTPLRTTTEFTSGNPSTTTNFIIPLFPEIPPTYPISTKSISNSPSESTKTKTLSPFSTSTNPFITKTTTSLVTTSKSQSSSNPPSKSSTEATTGTTTYLPITTSEHPTSSLTSSITTSTSSPSTLCHKCHWSDWIDKNHPTSDIDGGDEENFETAEAEGRKMCSDKKFIRNVQCAATSYPGISIEELSQTVICNIETGLLCRNRDNQGEFNMCYNYKVRFYCCEEYNCPSTRTTAADSTAVPSTTSSSLRTTTEVPSWNSHTSTVSSRSINFSTTHSTNYQSTTSAPNIQSTSTRSKTTSPLSTSTVPPTSSMATSLVTASKSKSTSNPPAKPSTKATTGTTTHLPITSSKHPTSSLTSSITTSTSSPSTPCHKCHWSDWIDKNHPTSDIDGGDEENFETAEAEGRKMCSDKKFIRNVQCSATSYPGIPIEELSQTVICNIETGLLCRNRDNQGEFNMCYNYKIRFYCCEEYNCPSTRTTAADSTAVSSTTSSSLRTTTEVPSWNSRTSTGSSRSVHFSTTHSKNSPSTTSIPHIQSTSTRSITTSPLSTSTVPPTPTMATSLVTTSRSQSTSNPPSKPSTETTTGTTTHSSVTSSKHSTSSLTSSITTSTSSPSTPCHKCHWSDWIDKNHPTSDFDGGDEENFETAEAEGRKMCSDKKFITDIQCSATSYPGISIEELSQTVICNIETGLLCRNRDNQGEFNMCYNYKVRFYCCDNYNCPSTTSPTTHSVPVSSTTSRSLRTTKVTSGNPTFSSRNPSHPPFSTSHSTNSPSTISIPNSHSTSTSTILPSTTVKRQFPATSTSFMPSSKPQIISELTSTTVEIKTSSHEPVTTTSKHTTVTHSSLTTPASTATERPVFCVHDGSRYKVGSSVPKDPESCQECKCTITANTAEVTCKQIVCNIGCQLGYSYVKVPGQCCGRCVENICFFDTNELTKDDANEELPEKCCDNCNQDVCSLNSTLIIKPGKLWHPPSDNCTYYDCDPRTLKIVKRVMSCPVQRPLTCEEGILVNFTSADGCCTIQSCEPRKCDVMKSWKVIESEGCTANVTLTNCGGYCTSISRHPSFPKMVEHDCTCCQPTKTTAKKIHLLCKDGRKTSYSYTDVLQCACRGAACVFTE